MRSSLWRYSAAVACVLAAVSVSAQAEECGDANDSGMVTVTDGVQTLRAAANLASSCSVGTCDVDGNGKITVTDGVNVLRKAAGIVVTEKCAIGVVVQVASLLRNSLARLSFLVKVATRGTGARAAAGGSLCKNPDGAFSVDQATATITFSRCDLGGIEFDGKLETAGNTVSLDLDFTNLTTRDAFSLLGDLTIQPSGDTSTLSGNLDITLPDQSNAKVSFENVVGDPAGDTLISGSLLFDASNAGIAGVVGIRIDLAPSRIVPVSMIMDDQSTREYTLDVLTGELTPVSP